MFREEQGAKYNKELKKWVKDLNIKLNIKSHSITLIRKGLFVCSHFHLRSHHVITK